jgi:hypothetical protein
MTIDETLNQLIAQRDSAIYRLIDYRIGIGEWKLEEDREQHFAEMKSVGIDSFWGAGTSRLCDT